MTTSRDSIRAEIKTTADEIRQLKRWWRTRPDERPDTPPPTRFALIPSKRRATLLCILMAMSRGRRHLAHRVDFDERAFIAEELDKMDAMRISTPVLDEGLRGIARAILDTKKAAA